MKLFQLENVLKSLNSGFSFRSKITSDPEGDLAVIQMKDVNVEYLILQKDPDRISSEEIHPKYNLQKGDVLFLAKGSKNVAITYQGQFDRAIASSSFFVLRPRQEIISSEYLAWYLNSAFAEKHFMEHRAGTSTQNLNRPTLESLEIRVPEKKLQNLIANLNFLSWREYLLVNEINERRKTLMSNQILKILESYDKR